MNTTDFKQEAIRRGFVPGAKIKTIKGLKVTLGDDIDYRLSGQRSWVADNDNNIPIIYRDGRWASVISHVPGGDIHLGDTVEAVEQNLGGSLVVGGKYLVTDVETTEDGIRQVDVEPIGWTGKSSKGTRASRFKRVIPS